jgi:hypothetical protein
METLEPALREKRRAKNRDSERKYKTGFTPKMVAEYRQAQEGFCAICLVALTPDFKKGPIGECADHCHETGKARGLLCRPCNISLGYYEKYQRKQGLILPPYEEYRARAG